MSSAIRVTGLFVYPVKSCAGTPLHKARVGVRGIEHDREFMLVGADQRFLTQRELPRLALIQPTLEPDGCLRLEAPDRPPFRLAPRECGERYEVVIWRDTVTSVPTEYCRARGRHSLRGGHVEQGPHRDRSV